VPNAIAHREIGLQVSSSCLGFARVRIRPLVRGHPAKRTVSVTRYTQTTQTCLLRQDVASLCHEGPDGKPKAVQEVERILQLLWVRFAGMRVVPLCWRRPENHNTATAHRVSTHAVWCIS
jgi:hypothetical protein